MKYIIGRDHHFAQGKEEKEREIVTRGQATNIINAVGRGRRIRTNRGTAAAYVNDGKGRVSNPTLRNKE